MREPGLKIELAVANFFAIPLKKIEIESSPATGRTYFIHRGRIVAVAIRSGGTNGNQ